MSAGDDLAPRRVLVTGAANGLGRDSALALLRDGWHVEAADIDEPRLESLSRDAGSDSGRLTTHRLDVRDATAVERVVDGLDGRPPLSALLNNAGLISAASVLDMSEDDWSSVIDVNVTGAFHVAQSVARRMIRSDVQRGRIVNIGSITGKSPRWDRVSYCVSKAAITMLTKCFALELASRHITVNTVSPGSTVGGVVQKNIEQGLSSVDRLVNGDPTTFRLGVPTRRMATNDDVIGAIRYLLSPSADQVTGAELRVDGGQGMF